MTVTETRGESAIQLSAAGNVDAVSAPELQKALLVAFQKKNNIVLDLGQVNYMSSAGLRALLIGHKTATSKGGSLRIINVQPSVRNIIEVTGFEQILNIV
jgi:anti-anti-sigma factor